MRPTATAAVWLSQQAHICNLGRSFIVLNVERDAYLSVAGSAAQCLRALMPDAPQFESSDAVMSSPDPICETSFDVCCEQPADAPGWTQADVEQLVAQGVLTTCRAEAR